MDFEFSEAQRQVGETVRRLLGDKATSARARASIDREPNGFDGELWGDLTQLGVPAIAIPEAFGGLGLSDIELCIVAEQVGRSLVRAPLASTLYWATEAINRLGSEAQKMAWLPGIAAGSCVAACVDTELAGFAPPAAVGTRLTGLLPVVADGAAADVVIIISADSAWIVGLDQQGVARSPLQTFDLLQPSARLEFSNARADPMVGAPLSETREHLRRRAAVLTAFEQIGGCHAALEEAVAYAKERRAFGRSVGSFQAIKHLLANMYVAAELARSNAYYAAWALTADHPALKAAAAAAHISATQAYRQCAADAIQVHGGIGFTWDMDCHLRYRRANHLALSLGPLQRWQDEMIESLVAQRRRDTDL